MKVDVVGIDYPPMNFVVLTDSIPQSNRLSPMLDHSWQGGGNVSTALIALARLGASCGIVGVVGGDFIGRMCIEDFQRHGIDTSRLIIDYNGNTPLSICIAERDTQGRSFISDRGTRKELIPEEIDRDYIASAKYLHLRRMYPAAVRAAQYAKEAGVKVVFDAGYFEQETLDHIGLIDVFIGSEYFYNGLFQNRAAAQENCEVIQEMGPSVVFFTFGAEGCFGKYHNAFIQQPAFLNLEVIDTTGAGDVFHGAFIFGMLQGWRPDEIARFSSAVSSIKCTRLGGRAGIPRLETVQEFLETGTFDEAEISERVAFYRTCISTR